jgi:predicted DNA-binding transcriptional regulator YafY
MSNTATRLITLIMLLQRRPNQKAGELAEALGISVRSLHRYISALEDMGIPIYSERGPHGGFSLVRGYKMPPLVFTPGEAVAVALGASLVGELWGPLYEEAAQGALAKLDNVLPDEQRQEIAWARQALIATALHRARVEPLAPHLQTLRTALREQRRVRMLHRGRGRSDPAERPFDPYALVHANGWWYVVGYCHLREDIRSFRVDRIVSVEVGLEPYSIPADFDVRAFMQFEQQTTASLRVTMRFFAFGADLARYNRSYWESYAEQPDGSVVVTFRAMDMDWATGMALSYGSLVIVEDPPELAALVAQRAAEVVAYYPQPTAPV